MATRSLNKVMLIGNLTRDPELRYTPAGTAVCTFGLATNRYWKKQTGETKEDTQFHRIVSWNKLAELCAQLLSKGRKVYVEGRLSTHVWTGQDNVQRTTTEVVIEDMIILDSKRFAREQVPVVAAEKPPTEIPESASSVQPQAQSAPSSTASVQTVSARSSSSSLTEEEEEEEKGKKEEKKEEKGGEESDSSKKSKKVKKRQKKEEKKEEEKANKEEKNEEITPDDIPF